MKTARIVCGLTAVAFFLVSSSALAQRVQLATPVSPDSSAAGPAASATSPSPVPSYPQSPLPSYPTPSLSQPAAAPTPTFSQPGTTFGAPSAGAPSPVYTPQPVLGAPPPVAPGGTIQPPPQNWDPWASPCNTPSPLMQQDPYLQSMPGISMGAMQKFVQHIDFDYDWFADNGSRKLGINDVDLSATFSFPIFHLETPLLVTPGFAVHYWAGPVSLPQTMPGQPAPADMPPQTFDSFLDAAWNPQITPWFGAELEFRIGVYSDFRDVTMNSLRYTGKGMGVISLSPSVKLKAGVWYLDRVKVKLLPAGGIVWTPNPDVYFNILFPNPKVAKRLTTWGNTEWWGYFSGEYGGGTWTIKRKSGLVPAPEIDGSIDTVDYNDIRIAGGLEFKTVRNFTGHIEVGLSCSRELIYLSGSPAAYYPTNTVYVGAGLSY